MSYDFLGDIDRIGMDAYKQGEEDAKKKSYRNSGFCFRELGTWW